MTYKSFRPKQTLKFWCDTETEYFYKALAAVGMFLGFNQLLVNLLMIRCIINSAVTFILEGSDFTLMCQMFPKRTRTEIKRKFKKEEKVNPHKVQMAMQGRLDFSQEPYPEEEEMRKKEEEKEKKRQQEKEEVRCSFYGRQQIVINSGPIGLNFIHLFVVSAKKGEEREKLAHILIRRMLMFNNIGLIRDGVASDMVYIRYFLFLYCTLSV